VRSCCNWRAGSVDSKPKKKICRSRSVLQNTANRRCITSCEFSFLSVWPSTFVYVLFALAHANSPENFFPFFLGFRRPNLISGNVSRTFKNAGARVSFRPARFHVIEGRTMALRRIALCKPLLMLALALLYVSAWRSKRIPLCSHRAKLNFRSGFV